ncbi:hypothetical protein TWF718_005310 [Orbilia javanica]|uniref:Uncharacterized protein n=1 Tax=Orbilia javanica TaxID=47235 RepID=A0AAN8RJA8_9PEZI
MCHKIYTFSKCHHIDISDDDKEFPPCTCKRVRGVRHLDRSCGACIRYGSPSFVALHKKAIENQVGRFKSLQLRYEEIRKLLPHWRWIVGVGTKMLDDWSDIDSNRGSLYDNPFNERILGAIDEEVMSLADGAATTDTTLVEEDHGPTAGEQLAKEVASSAGKDTYIVGPFMEKSGNLATFMK